MTAKDSSLFEARKHNFNVLLSDDEEINVVEKKETEAVPAVKPPVVATDASAEDDGFETFVSAKNKPKKSTGQYQSNKPRPASGHKPFPKELIIPKPETSIEFYDFASTLRTGDLRKLLQAHDGHYRLKWNHDTSCFVVFDNPALGKLSTDLLLNSNFS